MPRWGSTRSAPSRRMASGSVSTSPGSTIGSRVGPTWSAGTPGFGRCSTSRTGRCSRMSRTAPDVTTARRRSWLLRIWERLGMSGPPVTVTHVMVALWSTEVIEVLRRNPATFAAICPDPPDAFLGWWAGKPPRRGVSSSLVLLDPFASGSQSRFATLRKVLGGVPSRISGYAAAAEMVRAGSGRRRRSDVHRSSVDLARSRRSSADRGDPPRDRGIAEVGEARYLSEEWRGPARPRCSIYTDACPGPPTPTPCRIRRPRSTPPAWEP